MQQSSIRHKDAGWFWPLQCVCMCIVRAQGDTVAVLHMRARWGLNETIFDRCQCYLCVRSAVVNIHIKKIAAGEQAFVMDRSQLSNSWVVDCCGWQVVRGHEVSVSPDVQILLTLDFAQYWHNLNNAIWVFFLPTLQISLEACLSLH